MLLPIELINKICVMKRDMECIDETKKNKNNFHRLLFEVFDENIFQQYHLHRVDGVDAVLDWLDYNGLPDNIPMCLLPDFTGYWALDILDFQRKLGWMCKIELELILAEIDDEED